MLREVLRFFVAPIVLALVGAIATAPHWVHALDDGHARLLPSAVAQRCVGTSRVDLEGAIVHTHYINATTTTQMSAGESHSTEEAFVPIVDPGASPDEPVHVLFATGSSCLSCLRAPFRGVVRDAPMERGISDAVFTACESAGIRLAPDARIVTADWTGRDRFIAYGVTFALAVIGLFVSEQWRLRRKQTATRSR